MSTKQNKTRQKYFWIPILLVLTNAIYSQVKESEITSKNSRGKAELINFRETRINSDEKSVNQFLKKQFNSEIDVDFKLNSGNKSYRKPIRI